MSVILKARQAAPAGAGRRDRFSVRAARRAALAAGMLLALAAAHGPARAETGAHVSSAAASGNQSATAAAADALATTHPVSGAIASLGAPAAARSAFDQLSGEVHASARGVLADESRFVRSAGNDRIRAAFNSIAARQNKRSIEGLDRIQERPMLAARDGGAVVAPAGDGRFAVWTQSIGALGSVQTDGNAAGLSRSSGGVLAGADAALSDKWRVGVLGGYSSTGFEVGARNASGTSHNYHLGLYAGTPWAGFDLRGGATHTWHDTATNRFVAFAEFADTLTGSYQARTAQVFGELAYRVKAGPVGFEPFANVAYVNVQTDGFREAGGAAALSAQASSTGVAFATVGLRSAAEFTLGTVAGTVTGTVQTHVFGDVVPVATLSFPGGTPFMVAGAPVGQNALMLDAAVQLALAPNRAVGVSYGGQFAERFGEQYFKGNFALTF